MEGMEIHKLEKLTRLIRYWVLKMTTEAGSGHPTSCLSAVELMVGLMFGGYFRYMIRDTRYVNNDRLIFSKGHAAPLLYALWSAVKDTPLFSKAEGTSQEGSSASPPGRLNSIKKNTNKDSTSQVNDWLMTLRQFDSALE